MPFEVHFLSEIARQIESRSLVILAGAGISFAPPACAPLFRPLRDNLLKALTLSVEAELTPELVAQCNTLFDAANYPRSAQEPPPEVLFESCRGVLGDALFDLLRVLLESPAPNTQHEFVAQLCARGLPLLITTNFERCFELAIEATGRRPRICADGSTIQGSVAEAVSGSGNDASPLVWKPHGTLDRGLEDTIRITLSQVHGEARDEQKAQSLLAVFKTRPLLVMGYSGYDADISEMLKQAGREGGGIYWLARTPPRPDEPCSAILARYETRGHLITGTIAELFADLAGRLGLKFSPPPEDLRANDTLRRRAEGLRPILDQLPAQHRLLALGVLLQSLGRYEAALQLYDRGGMAAMAGNDGPVFGVALTLRYYLLKDWGRVQEAAGTLKMIQEIRTAAGKQFPLAPYLEAQLALAGQDFGAAGTAFQNARRQLAEDGEPFTANVDHSEGILLSQQGKHEEAAELFQRSLEASIKTNDLELELRSRHELGILEIDRGHIAEATRIFEGLRDNAHQTGKPNLEQGALYELGLIAANHTHQYLKARQCFAEALRLADELKLAQQAVRCLVGLADTDYEEGVEIENDGLIKNADRRFGHAIEAARLVGDDFTRATAYLRRGRCRLMLGRNRDAIEDLTAGLELAQQRGFATLIRDGEMILQFLESVANEAGTS